MFLKRSQHASVIMVCAQVSPNLSAYRHKSSKDANRDTRSKLQASLPLMAIPSSYTLDSKKKTEAQSNDPIWGIQFVSKELINISKSYVFLKAGLNSSEHSLPQCYMRSLKEVETDNSANFPDFYLTGACSPCTDSIHRGIGVAAPHRGMSSTLSPQPRYIKATYQNDGQVSD